MRKAGSGSADLLALGFGTVVAMWAVGYVSRIPPAWVPSPVLLVLLAAVLFAGGYATGRSTARGWKGGLAVGAIASLGNLLILGSLLTGKQPNQIVPSALLWIPGSFAASLVLSTLGAVAGGRRFDPARESSRNWTGAFARVAVLATLLLLIVGGLVTSKRAGLAVVDWPNSYGYSMFLYPLSRMTGGIYYEHAHRLFGTLVGLTTLVLAIHLQRADARPWLRAFSLAALLVVIIQGLLGGLRVTGRFTMSQDPAETDPNLLLAVVHGVLAQVFFGMIVAIAVFTSTTWKSDRLAVARGSAGTERTLSAALVPLLLVQIILGAIQRHLAGGLHIHITLGVLVFLLAAAVGIRLWGSYGEVPPLARVGRALVIHVGAQIVLGVLALVGRGMADGVADPPAFSVVARTLHQAVGAALLALGVMAALWSRRLLDATMPAARERTSQAG